MNLCNPLCWRVPFLLLFLRQVSGLVHIHQFSWFLVHLSEFLLCRFYDNQTYFLSLILNWILIGQFSWVVQCCYSNLGLINVCSPVTYLTWKFYNEIEYFSGRGTHTHTHTLTELTPLKCLGFNLILSKYIIHLL